ncbi:hypothetical protein ASPZODRAFT_68587 [Penicilliopsis zonata CBS 506.65]|uniref:Uncharacterized protein n=1 Tax=Penicilliopsis zonata CBS 506.65 TaxID=1073090 RepID=A0A1L9SF25_9EURO|nr:hypothetical protein ASPZODRAFT_68587 [Penicilliopsis zonata CBS 506.65]OJJ45820.1 hypothetical protein ASPZODRAFT_68587 [Penicilliopsis zonata CBS 506.65]
MSDAVAHANQGEFKPSVHSTAPMEQEGHQPGRKVAPADHRPEYRAETFPPGTAPASSSYQPNPVSDPGSQALNPLTDRAHGKEKVFTSAGLTLRGATSQDVHRGLGHPGSGMTNTEIRHDGQHGRKHQSHSLEGVGATREDKYERALPDQRGIEREEAMGGQHGNKGVAEELLSTSAETVAHEWKYEPGTKRGQSHIK